jgi:hypothetical protein
VNAQVHYAMTREWAVEAGFSEQEAETIAQADVGVDHDHGGDLLHPQNWSYHYRLFGADRLADRGVRDAIAHGCLEELGIALHRAQDAIAHGWLGLASHAVYPYVDVWERRSPAVRERIESRSRRMLASVAKARGASPDSIW